MRAVSFSLSLLILTALHIALAPADQAAAQAPDPLTLTITAERAECTAGTLNPVSWTISGGTAPYTLTVAGQSVDPTAESVNVTCGALPEGASEAPATVTAVVTDAAGTTVTASTAYTIVPPLPAPTGVTAYAHRTSIGIDWERVAAAGPVPGVGSDCPCPPYLLRWRVDGADNWTTHLDRDRDSSSGQVLAGTTLLDIREGTAYELAVATLRDAIEQETPGALNWSAPVTAITWVPATGVRAVTTHDTITVTWDSQPATDVFEVSIFGPDGDASQFFRGDGTTPHQVVFQHLPPDTEYTVRVWVAAMDQGPRTEITARTKAAPAEWTPLPRGPQNVRTAVTHNSVTVDWDAPYAGARDTYQVWLFHTGADREPTAADRSEYRRVEGAGVTQHTFAGLARGTTYIVSVSHPSIVTETVRVAVTTLARAAPPLRLTLTAARAECTAGTLNPITWEIEGGVEPYRLTVDGASVDADAESAAVTCGALPDYGIWLPVTQAPGTITAVVTDATGAPATASAAYTIVPPLPAPRLRPGPMNVEETTIFMGWWPVPGARPASGVGHYLLRSRPAQTSTWRYVTVENQDPPNEWVVGAVWELEGGETYQHQSAAMRDPIEQETPEQLAWTATQTTTTAHPPTGVVATATHDTLTVRWDPQTASDLTWVTVNPHQAGMRPIEHSWRGGDQPADQVTFTGLTPATTYTVTVSVQGDFPEYLSTTIQAETTPAPPGWEPPPRGPQNIRTSATHDSITVRWEHPRPGAPPLYLVLIDDPIGAGSVVEWVHGRTEFTANLLAPNTTYTVEIRHLDIIKAPVTVEVRTNAPPATGPSASPTLTCFEYLVGAVVCTWETSLARPPV